MIIVSVLVVLLAIGVPIAVAILAVTTWLIAHSNFPFSLIAQQTFSGLDSFTLLAIPLFILAGELMNSSGITGRIVSFANALVGQFKSGLAQVNIWASFIFAGISGSAVADTSALGRVFIPSMKAAGYPDDVAAALVAAASVIGPVVPPSIPVIIYALIYPVASVPAMFLGGAVPGLLLAVGLSVYLFLFAPRYGQAREALPIRERLKAFVNALVPLAMPVFIVGSIVLGIVTPTEAAAFAVFYALIAGLFILRSLKLSDIPGVFIRSMRDSAVILVIIATISLANWLLTYAQIPQNIATFVLHETPNKYLFLLMVNVFLLLVGLVLEGTSAMLVLVPILAPIATTYGIDPTHFAIVVIANLMIGLITPPMGLCLFVADSIANVGILRLTKRIIPLFLVEVAVLFVITYIPALVTWLPSQFGY